MANSAGVPAPSTKSSRTRWPGDFGATIATSTSGRTVIVLNRMLKPCANITMLPGARFGSMSSRYTFGCIVSGMRIMTTSAHLATSARLHDAARHRHTARAHHLDDAVGPQHFHQTVDLVFRPGRLDDERLGADVDDARAVDVDELHHVCAGVAGRRHLY